MKIVRRLKEMTGSAHRWRLGRRTIGLVPTMGALHRGHISLIQRARKENDRVVVSVFVNPTQFGPQEDFKKYPRPFKRDAQECRRAGADIVFHPSASSLYPEGFSTAVEVGAVAEPLEGAKRPGHFRGVATVVLKLLEITRPDRLYLGEKDFQQLQVVRRMVSDLEVPVKVVGCPTVRERGGLALSSRNSYLSPSERSRALNLFLALRVGAREARRRGADLASVRRAMRSAARGLRVEYLEIADAGTLRRPQRLRGRLRLLGAVRIGKTRLIDNIPLIV